MGEGTSLAVQWLGPWDFTAGVMGSILSQGTDLKMAQAMWQKRMRGEVIFRGTGDAPVTVLVPHSPAALSATRHQEVWLTVPFYRWGNWDERSALSAHSGPARGWPQAGVWGGPLLEGSQLIWWFSKTHLNSLWELLILSVLLNWNNLVYSSSPCSPFPGPAVLLN